MAGSLPTLTHYIGGEWISGGDRYPVENPSDLDNPVLEYSRGDAAQVDLAVTAARAAFPEWSSWVPRERAQALDVAGQEIMARSEELGVLLSMEEGKTRAEGIGEVRRAGEIFRYFASRLLDAEGELLAGFQPGVTVEVRRKPRGVVGIITPWNFPAAIPAWKIAPALAYGNTVVFKPAELVPGTAWSIVEILSRTGIPAGTVNMVLGSGSEVGNALVEHPDVDAISFTGSTSIGRTIAVAAASRLAPVQLELGGKNSLVVLDDADLDRAVANAVNGAYYSTGQRCTASSRLLVTAGVHDEFVDRLAEAIRSVRTGPSLDPAVQVGPVVDARQLASVQGYLEVGRAEGATELIAGEMIEAPTRGHFLSPALFVDTAAGMRINTEEIFGPVATVTKVADYDEALAQVNDSRYGLVAGIMTGSLRLANHFKANAQVGMTMINMPTAGMDYHAPFGGTKDSGYGPREQGSYAREFYTEVVSAYVRS